MRDRDVQRAAHLAEARALLRAELRALVAAYPHLRGRCGDAGEVIDAAGVCADAGDELLRAHVPSWGDA